MRYRALLAAIDNYGHPRNNLPSCLNDLSYMQQLLRSRLGAPPDKIKALTDAEVTVEAVETGLKWLTSDTAEDERLLFFYSGHGFQIPDADASDSVKVEEGLVLSQDKFFLDNELVKASQAARPGTLTMLLDCCFGGGNEKMYSPAGGRLGSVITPKRWAPPTDFIAKHEILRNPQATPVASYKPFGMRPITDRPPLSVVLSATGSTTWPTAIDEEGQPLVNGALLAACLEDETASASTDKTDGLSAFTYALKRMIEQQGLDLSLQEVRDGTDRILKAMRFRQTSTLKIGTGPIDRDSRFLSLQRKTPVPSRPTDRRTHMADPKFLEQLAPIIIDRVIRELTSKGIAPTNSGGEKFGFEILIPPLVDVVVRELTNKGYTPASGGAGKFAGPSDWDRLVRDPMVRSGDGLLSAGEKGLGDIVRDIAERAARELVERGVRELTKGPRPTSGTDKFFPGAEIILPIVVERVVEHFAR